MGPNFWRHPANGLKKCSEKTRTSCTDHDDCCAVTACTYCLELEVYGDPVQHGVADQAANHWTGTVGGYPFDMYWERNYETGVCELIVIFDGEEVYRKTCDEGQSCRDSTDSVEVIVGYPPESATLRWIKHEPLALPHVNDPDTGCKTWFCGECECSCECLCVTITEPDGDVFSGEICSGAYECDGPTWEGTIGYYELSIRLDRGVYGECVLVGTVNGDEQEPVEASGCKDMSATITLYDGTTIAVRCKVCSCEQTITIPCCEDIPITAESLNVRIEGLTAFGPEGQFADCTWEGSIPLYTVDGPYFRTWAGKISLSINGGCGGCCDNVTFFVLVQCDGTQEHTLCMTFWYAVEGTYTLTPLDAGNTGWAYGPSGAESGQSWCAPLIEFAEATETDFASCSPLMLVLSPVTTLTFNVYISELALP